MFTRLGQARHGSRLGAWLSVLGLIIAMFAASIDPADASVTAETGMSIVVFDTAPDAIGGHEAVLGGGGGAQDAVATD